MGNKSTKRTNTSESCEDKLLNKELWNLNRKSTSVAKEDCLELVLESYNDLKENSFYVEEAKNNPTMSSFDLKEENFMIILNVGGVKNQISWRNIERCPCSRLCKLRNAKTNEEILESCDSYDLVKNEYFFDRNPHSFTAILDFYRRRSFR